MNRPNLYKAMMALMDVTYTELAEEFDLRGFKGYGVVSEICRAVRGCKSPRYDRIREEIFAVFAEWLWRADMSPEGHELSRYLKIGEVMKHDKRSPLTLAVEMQTVIENRFEMIEKRRRRRASGH